MQVDLHPFYFFHSKRLTYYSRFAVPNHMKSELLLIFPGVDLSEVKAIITMQHAKYDLVNIGPDVDKEKDDLLEKVITNFSPINARW